VKEACISIKYKLQEDRGIWPDQRASWITFADFPIFSLPAPKVVARHGPSTGKDVSAGIPPLSGAGEKAIDGYDFFQE
jgi:hypothetical protein